MEIILADPRGFCAGVERAIEIVEKALEKFGPPIYVRNDIVHNTHVVQRLINKGVKFVKHIDDIPEGAMTIFSAHGVSEKVEEEAAARNLPTIDATCPLVTRVHREAKAADEKGRQVILIGHAGHAEVEGTSGRVKQDVLLVQKLEDVAQLEVKDPQLLTYVTQTTLSVDDTKVIIEALVARFPDIEGPHLKDICYATQNRQNAVHDLATQTDMIWVIGSSHSSNSNRLRDIAEKAGVDAYLINDMHDIDVSILKKDMRLGLTAGASAPEELVEQVIDYVKQLYPETQVRAIDGRKENVRFKLPDVLKKVS